MSIDVRVPTTGNAGEDAVIVDWNVTVGSQVSAGDVLVTLETAKAIIEVEAPESGEVLRILFGSGDEVPEHEVLAVLGAAGEIVADSGNDPDAEGPAAVASNRPFQTIDAAPGKTSTPAHTSPSSSRGSTKASPRARVLAAEKGIDLVGLTGSGPGGRVVIADVLAARPELPGAPLAAEGAHPTARAADEFDLVPVRGARKVTAQRMHASLSESAQVTLTRYADASALLAYMKRLRTVTEAEGLPKVGVNDLVLFATARAVTKHPAANSVFDWDGIRQYRSVNLGFAVDTGQALLVPVIPGAHALSISQIAAASKVLIDKARSGKLTTPEMEGGTFTVSNLGSLGIHWFTPVLNTPQSCILGVGAAHQSHPDSPTLLPLSLTFDHRAIDGAAAAMLLADISKTIETVDVLSAL